MKYASFDVSDGLWATDASGQIRNIARVGDLLPGGFSVTALDIGPSTGNEDGLASSFNDRGEFLFRAFSGYRMGIFLSQAVAIPEPSTATLQLFAIAIAGLLSRRARA